LLCVIIQEYGTGHLEPQRHSVNKVEFPSSMHETDLCNGVCCFWEDNCKI